MPPSLKEKGKTMSTIPTNLWKFGIPVEGIELFGEKYFIKLPAAAKFLGINLGTLHYRTRKIVQMHGLLEQQEIRKTFGGKQSSISMSETVFYLLVMALKKTKRAKELRMRFVEILASADIHMILPFPKEQLLTILSGLKSTSEALGTLGEELVKLRQTGSKN